MKKAHEADRATGGEEWETLNPQTLVGTGEPKVTCHLASKGRPRLRFNRHACLVLGIESELACVLRLKRRPNAAPILGVMLLRDEASADMLSLAARLCVHGEGSRVQGDLKHAGLAQLREHFKRVVWRPRAATPEEGPMDWILEPVLSER